MKLINIIFIFVFIPLFASLKAQTTDSCICTRTIAEQMPVFKKCIENHTDYLVQKSCSDQAFLDFLYSKVRYSSSGKDISPSRMVFQFIITDTGKMVCIRCLRSSGYPDLDAAVSITLQKMATEWDWQPAQQEGNPVCVLYRFPLHIHFQH